MQIMIALTLLTMSIPLYQMVESSHFNSNPFVSMIQQMEAMSDTSTDIVKQSIIFEQLQRDLNQSKIQLENYDTQKQFLQTYAENMQQELNNIHILSPSIEGFIDKLNEIKTNSKFSDKMNMKQFQSLMNQFSKITHLIKEFSLANGKGSHSVVTFDNNHKTTITKQVWQRKLVQTMLQEINQKIVNNNLLTKLQFEEKQENHSQIIENIDHIKLHMSQFKQLIFDIKYELEQTHQYIQRLFKQMESQMNRARTTLEEEGVDYSAKLNQMNLIINQIKNEIGELQRKLMRLTKQEKKDKNGVIKIDIVKLNAEIDKKRIILNKFEERAKSNRLHENIKYEEISNRNNKTVHTKIEKSYQPFVRIPFIRFQTMFSESISRNGSYVDNNEFDIILKGAYHDKFLYSIKKYPQLSELDRFYEVVLGVQTEQKGKACYVLLRARENMSNPKEIIIEDDKSELLLWFHRLHPLITDQEIDQYYETKKDEFIQWFKKLRQRDVDDLIGALKKQQ
eukprot:130813_1